MTYNTLVIGSPKTGKTTILVNRALESIEAEEPVIFIDAVGNAVDDIAHRTKPKHWDSTTLLDFSLHDPTPLTTPRDKDTVLALFRDLADYKTSTNLFDNLVSMLAASVLPQENTTFLHMLLMLYSDRYREKIVKTISNPWVQAYWTYVYDTWDKRQRTQNTQSTLTQLNLFATNDTLRRWFCYPHATFSLTDKRTVLIKIPRQKLGTKTTRQIGLVLLSMLPKTHHVFIDDAAQFDGDLLHHTLSDNRTTLSLTERGQQDWVLNNTGEKLILPLNGVDAEYFNRVLGRTGKVTGQIQSLDLYFSVHVAPGKKMTFLKHDKTTKKTYARASQTLRSERPVVSAKKVDAATRQIAEQNLVH